MSSGRLMAAGLILISLASLTGVVTRPTMFRALALLPPDSTTYLEWNPGRTPAYPLALSIMRTVTGSLDGVAWLQYAALVASAATLAWSYFVVYRFVAAAVLLFCAVVLHPQIVSYAFTILPESLFMSALMLQLALVLRASMSHARGVLAAISVLVALMILLKPSAYALLACFPLLLFRRHGASWRNAINVAGPAVAILVTVSAANWMTRGFFAPQAQGGYSLVAHAGPFVEPVGPPYEAVSNAIAADVAPHRHALESIESLNLYYLFSSHDYHVIERIVRRRIAEDYERTTGATVTDTSQFPADANLLQHLTTVGATLARSAILDEPGAYLRHVGAQVYGLWMLPLIQTGEGIERLRADLESVRSQSVELDRSEVAFRPAPAIVVTTLRAGLGAAFVMAIVAVMAFIMRPHAGLWLPAAYAGLAVHANFLLVAAVQPGLPRYALVMWPAICTLVVTSASALYKQTV